MSLASRKVCFLTCTILTAMFATTLVQSTAEAQLLRRLFNRNNQCCPQPVCVTSVYRPVVHQDPCCGQAYYRPAYHNQVRQMSAQCGCNQIAYAPRYAYPQTRTTVAYQAQYPAMSQTGLGCGSPVIVSQYQPQIRQSEINRDPYFVAPVEETQTRRVEVQKPVIEKENGDKTAPLIVADIDIDVIKDDENELADEPKREEESNSKDDQAAEEIDNEQALTAYYSSRLVAQNECVVELAELAKNDAADQKVKDLATTLVDDHQAMIKKLDSLENSSSQVALVEKMSSLDSKISSSAIKSAKEMLSSHEGRDFDMAFIGMQVAKHAMLKAELDSLDGVGTEEFQQVISDLRQTVDSHMKAAQDLYTEKRKEMTEEQN